MVDMRSLPAAAPLLLIMVLGIAAPAAAQVLRVADLNTEQIRALDRARTVVILPGGILEQHGPHLPSYSDGYFNERLSQAVAEAVAARSGWAALVFPQIPLGTGGANEIGRKYVFPGTYAVRSTTLRSVFMDLASELGEQGFRWVFIACMRTVRRITTGCLTKPATTFTTHTADGWCISAGSCPSSPLPVAMHSIRRLSWRMVSRFMLAWGRRV